MKIAIYRNGMNIVTIKDYRDIDDKGEIGHILMEMELIKKELVGLWEKINNKGY